MTPYGELGEFIRRFSLHILPKAFVRIRHYGILSSTAKTKAIDRIRKLLPERKSKITKPKATPYNRLQCQCCKKETMIRLLNFDQRGPPKQWQVRTKQLIKNLQMN